MFLNSWSLALTICSLTVIFLVGLACRSAVRVLRFWDPASDSNRQIELESEIWLTSTLVEYGLWFQIISLILFILAADHYCQVIVGAMCATGALLANDFGLPTLLLKLCGVFLYGFWIVLHQLDVSSENYPLVRIKYIFLLLLSPLLLVDITLQSLYIAGLSPDIITSCCAVVFGESSGDGRNLMTGFDQETMLNLFYGGMAILTVVGGVLWHRWNMLLAWLFATGWAVFFVLALITITTVISSYVYAMPFHRCPFCLLKPEYNYFGFALYGSLLGATFFGVSAVAVEPCKRKADLQTTVARFQQLGVKLSLLFLFIFAILSSYHYLLYKLFGGET